MADWNIEALEKDLLNTYSKFLEERGYLDVDWRTESPFAIDEFMQQRAVGKLYVEFVELMARNKALRQQWDDANEVIAIAHEVVEAYDKAVASGHIPP